MASNVVCSPFSRAVFSAMRKLYPEALADKSFDNTGLLLEAPFNPEAKLRNSVLLTIDLTTAVADEAIANRHSVVVTYPNSQHQSLLRLAAKGISVYCPHTAVDAAVGGNADWMADIITGAEKAPPDLRWTGPDEINATNCFGMSNNAGSYGLFSFTHTSKPDPRYVALNALSHTRTAIKPNCEHEAAGLGRVVRFSESHALSDILRIFAKYFLYPRAFSVALPYGKEVGDVKISSVGICAGSGGSVLGDLDDIDLLVTGELSHHEALAATESGKSVIALGHSNSERGFLTAVMTAKLTDALEDEWVELREEELAATYRGYDHEVGPYEAMLRNGDIEVVVSEKDKDPFDTAIWLEPGDNKGS